MRARTNTVVIIEDEPAAADALAMIIRDWGADVAVGADTTAITEQLGPRVNEVGWIITDFDLGRCDFDTGLRSRRAGSEDLSVIWLA